MKKNIEFFESQKTFCHGDFSLENIICNEKGLFLIDPIYDEKSYSSWLLDFSKLLMSLRKNDMMIERDFILSMFSKLETDALNILEISQWIRIYKYSPNSQREFVFKTINNLINNLCCVQ